MFPIWQTIVARRMIDGILCIELCHCFGVGTVNADTQFLINSRGSMAFSLLTFGETSTAVQGPRPLPSLGPANVGLASASITIANGAGELDRGQLVDSGRQFERTASRVQ
jgi:hypothetical protein